MLQAVRLALWIYGVVTRHLVAQMTADEKEGPLVGRGMSDGGYCAHVMYDTGAGAGGGACDLEDGMELLQSGNSKLGRGQSPWL
jgi:hypothetical protein